MAYEIVWLEQAERAIDRIYAKLLTPDDDDTRSKQFLVEAIGKVDDLATFPRLGREVGKGFRRLLLWNNRYGLYYEIAGRRVIIHRIVDLRQESEQIERELK
ncbi:MAG: type II toxin-antitoxin system RelE/ParE family toxin [Opitutales bacterium]